LVITSLFAAINARSQCGGNPVPNAIASPTNQTICSGAAITPIILSGSVSGTTFNWTRNNTSNVTGIATSGSGNISGAMINNTNSPQLVTFTITPQTPGPVQIINEGFNSVLPAGWAQVNNSSTIGTQPLWYAGTAFPPYSPTEYVAVNYNCTTSGNSISNWLMTPVISIRAGDYFSFYTRNLSSITATYGDR